MTHAPNFYHQNTSNLAASGSVTITHPNASSKIRLAQSSLAVPGADSLVFLLNGENSFVDSSIYGISMRDNGGASITSSSPKFGTNSVLFDGTNDYLDYPATVPWTIGTGNFEICGWVNFTALGGSQVFMDTRGAGGAGGTGVMLFHYSSGATNYIAVAFGASVILQYAATLSTSTWYHVACIRSGTTVALLIDGVQRATTTNASSIVCPAGRPQFGKSSYDSPNTGWFNGKLDDWRIHTSAYHNIAGFTPEASAYVPDAARYKNCVISDANISGATTVIVTEESATSTSFTVSAAGRYRNTVILSPALVGA